MDIAEKVLQLKQDFDDVYAAGKAEGNFIPAGHWERYVETGIPIGASEYDYPTQKHVLEDIRLLTISEGRKMPNGETVYNVSYGSELINTIAYKEILTQGGDL